MLYPRDVQTDADIPPHRFLRNKPIATRLAVVTAGPFANLLLAIVVLTAARHQEGIPVLPTTTLDAFPAESAEARAGFRAGDEIVSIGGRPVRSTLEISEALDAQGNAPFDVVVRRPSGVDTTIALTGVRRARGEEFFPDFRYRSEARIGTVKKDGPAARAGLLPGDRIVEVDGEPIRYYDELASRIRPAIGKPLQIVWERNGERQSATVTPEAGDAPDPENPNKLVQVGRLQIEMHRETAPVGWGTAFRSSLASTWFLTRATFEFLGQVVRGKGSRDAVGGPIRIAQEAGSELRWGLSRLFTFMAFFSVNLFLLNLLPIPVLDGGHVLFLLIEAVRGEALSTRVQEWALRVGVSALIALMGWVVAMDLWRVISR
jgi:regulator of sigma E protease